MLVLQFEVIKFEKVSLLLQQHASVCGDAQSLTDLPCSLTLWQGWSEHRSLNLNSLMQSACLPCSSTEPTSNVSSCPPGGAISGMEPTVDTVVVQPVPAFWYYVLAGGGALLVLVSITVLVILCCHRYHWATKKTSSSHHHSVTYRNNQLPYQQGRQNWYQSQNPGCNLIHSPNQNNLNPSTGPSLEPMLTISLEKEDSYDSQCWKGPSDLIVCFLNEAIKGCEKKPYSA